MVSAKEIFLSNLPDYFKEYMFKELNSLRSKYLDGVVFWSREDDEPQRVFCSREDDEPQRLSSTLPDGDISNLNKIIRDLLYRIRNDWAPSSSLVQFWARITTKEGRSFLTTRNQPFSLTSFWYEPPMEGLLGYRMICMDSKFDIDLDGGTSLPGRVFKHQFPESTPNVEFYSITEYPQRDDALRCGVRESFAFPVFESSTQRCVGVIEVVAPPKEGVICNSYFGYEIYKDFEEFGLKCSAVFDHQDMELDEDENEARTIALDEIKNVLKMVCDVHDLPLAHAWVPCEVGCPCRARVDGGILHASCYYKKDDYGEDEDDYGEDEDDYGENKNAFHHISSSFHLKNGVGVVGRALLSTNMVFCRDVAQLSLTEYPLAHYARKAGLSGCLAICLESNCTGNDVYVLEFFMPMSNNASENPHTSLRKILETMRKNFRCLRVATREELEEELHIEEISIQNGEKLDPVQIPQTTISLPQLELSQSEVEVMQVDSSDQQLVNAINTGSNVFGTEHNNIAITCTQEKDTVKASKRKGNKSGGTVKASTRKGDKSGGTGKASTRKGDKSGGTVKASDREDNKTGVKIEISLEEILQTSKMKLEDAAQSLGVSKSTLKCACREYCIEKWHPRNINKNKNKNKGKAPMDPTVKKSAPPSMPKLMRDSITDLQEQEQRKIKATQTTSREVRSKKRQGPSTTSMLQEDFNPTFSERDIPLSQIFEPTVHNSPDQTYQRKRRRVLISIDIEDEESPNSTPKEASQTPSNTQPHHPSKPSDPILNQFTLNNSPDVTLEAFPIYPGTTEPMNFPSVTSLDLSQNGNPTSIDEIPTRSHCDISSPLNDQFNEPSQSKFQTNPETETQVEGTPTNGPEPTNENNTEVRTEKMDNAPSSDKQVGEHTPTPMDDSPHGINQTTGVKNMEQNPSVNENTEDINPHATSEPPGISSSLQALEVPSTLISLETPHVSMEKTTIGETSTPITNPLNPASTVVQASSSSNTGSLSIWEEIAAFQKSVEHISPLPKRLHHFNPEDQQVVSSFLNLINTSFEEIISKQSMETLNCLTAIQRLSPTPFSQNQLSHLAQIISEWSIIVEAAQNCRNTIQTKKDFLMAVQTTSDSLITTCQASFNLSDQDRSLALQETRLEAELALVRQKRHELQKEMDKLGHEAKILLSKTENNLSSIQAAKEEFEQAQATFATTQSKWSILAHIFPRD